MARNQKKQQQTAPARKPLAEYLKSTAVASLVGAVVIDFLIASLATSRATAHALTPGALVLVVAGAAMTIGVLVAWPNALYTGARDVLTEAAVLGCEPGCKSDPAGDPWETGRLWGSTVVLSALVGAWALAGAGLVTVALGGKHARLVVVWAALLGISGLSATFIEIVGRHRGAHAARAVLVHGARPVPLRERAWKHLAAPLAVQQVIVNAGFAWVLFHDYKTGDRFAAHALTKSVALADALMIVVVVAVLFGTVATGWGAVDALLGRVEPDEPDVQTVSAKSPLGVQGVVYVGIAGFLLGKLASMVLPGTPSLFEVAVVRGVYAGVLVFLMAGVAYVRGAVNARAALEAASRTAAVAAEVAA